MDALTREIARIVRQEVDAALAEFRQEILVDGPAPCVVERQPITERSKYLGTQAAADYLGLSRRTLYNLRAARGGPVARKHGRLVKYLNEDLETWMERRLK